MESSTPAGKRPTRKAICFGNALTLLALGGEVVVDYDLRAKWEYPGEPGPYAPGVEACVFEAVRS